jgi:hypothetical protein
VNIHASGRPPMTSDGIADHDPGQRNVRCARENEGRPKIRYRSFVVVRLAISAVA